MKAFRILAAVFAVGSLVALVLAPAACTCDKIGLEDLVRPIEYAVKRAPVNQQPVPAPPGGVTR